MILRPEYVVADEPTSNLDASIRASIVKLLLDFKERYGVSMLFITHDIVLISLIASRIGVLYLGQLVEEDPAEEVVDKPLHPYTKTLLTAIPLAGGRPGLEKVYLRGEIGDPSNPPSGCRLHPRCPSPRRSVVGRSRPWLKWVRGGLLGAGYTLRVNAAGGIHYLVFSKPEANGTEHATFTRAWLPLYARELNQG
jgi:peptide/nickel transport system ATP-binding protein